MCVVIMRTHSFLMHKNFRAKSALEFFIFLATVVIRIHPKRMMKQFLRAVMVCKITKTTENKFQPLERRGPTSRWDSLIV